jgi:hypothetical protein
MKKLPQSEDSLVVFLRNYHSVAPEARADLENNLMAKIQNHSVNSRKNTYKFSWILPSAIAGGTLIAWSTYCSLSPKPQAIVNSEELEIFVVDNWENTIKDRTYSPNFISLEQDWLSLTESQSSFQTVKTFSY